jgi:hypothetical protein
MQCIIDRARVAAKWPFANVPVFTQDFPSEQVANGKHWMYVWQMGGKGGCPGMTFVPFSLSSVWLAATLLDNLELVLSSSREMENQV